MSEETKECRKCGDVLPVSAFGKRSSTKDGLQSYCYECQKADNRERWKARPDWKNRDINLRRRYKISQADFRLMSDSQGNRCKLCGVHEDERQLVVDHCHDTGEVRGLLCSHCNQGIGFLGDGRDLDIFIQAIDYLSK